jgi:hypothetical protein
MGNSPPRARAYTPNIGAYMKAVDTYKQVVQDHKQAQAQLRSTVKAVQPSHRPAQPQDFPDAPRQLKNEFGTPIEAGGFKLDETKSTPAKRVCMFFNKFWALMNTALEGDREAYRKAAMAASASGAAPPVDIAIALYRDYRHFYDRFCGAMTQGAIENKTQWSSWVEAYAIMAVSAYIFRHDSYNEEVLAREMWARYIVSPLLALGPDKVPAGSVQCVSAAHSDRGSPYTVYVSDQKQDLVPYKEVGSKPNAAVLCTIGGMITIRHATYVWQGKAYGPCRAVPFMFYDRQCATSAEVQWDDREGGYVIPDGRTSQPVTR